VKAFLAAPMRRSAIGRYTEREWRTLRLPLEWPLEPMIWSAHAVREHRLAPERAERKLAAVLAADIAGYSRLIGGDS